MKASTLIDHKVVHATDPDMTGVVTDILFDVSLKETVFFLVDTMLPSGTAPVLFSPAVIIMAEDVLQISAHPDDIAKRHQASIHRADVSLDPGDLPSVFIGPFGNTFSPSMIAALFNARTAVALQKPPMQTKGVWFTELHNHAIRAHVGDIGNISDMSLDDDLTQCENVEITVFDGQIKMFPPAGIQVERSLDQTLLLSVIQTDTLS